jgi:microcystin-dependent protein
MATPYISEIRHFPWNWAPKNWALCDGRLLPISQNQALFALLGTTYGGNGIQNFALPDLRSRAAIHFNMSFSLGEMGGVENATLLTGNLPIHNHGFEGSNASGNKFDPGDLLLATNGGNHNFYGPVTNLQPLNPTSVALVGGNQPHNNMQPYLVLNYCIAIYGVFPSRN